MSAIQSAVARHIVPSLGLVALAALPAARPHRAHDGVVSLAFLLEGVEIDGDLGDWPEGLPEYGVANFLAVTPEDDDDLKVDFRTGYDEDRGALLVAVRVRDDVHTLAPGEGLGPDDQDRCMLLFDPVHAAEPGLPLWYEAALEAQGRTLLKATSDGAPREGVRVAARRVGDATHYEWSLPLEKPWEYRTLGLDVQVTDFDGADAPLGFAVWGPSPSKTEITGRLGDVALMDPAAFPGTLAGTVRWEDWGGRALERLELTNLEEPRLSFRVAVSRYGQYRVELPPGEYRVAPALPLTDPLGNEGGERRLDVEAHVRASVEAEGSTQAPELVVATLEPPAVPVEHVGLLHRFQAEHPRVIDELVRAWMDYYAVPGVSLALLQEGEVVHHRTFGVRNLQSGAPVEPTTLFEAASITKPVFAFAVLRLVDRGVLELDHPLHEYLPFPNIAGDPRSRAITARLVLSHSSGLPNWAWGGPGGWRDGGPLTLEFEPGERFGYSGEAYDYLGRVLEKLTGKDLEQLLQEEVAEVLGMQRVHFSSNERLAAVASNGHWVHGVSHAGLPAEVSPASSMHTEALDFSAFLRAVIDRRGLEPETWAAFLRPQRAAEDRGPLRGWKQSVGLGLFLRETPHGTLIEHGGNNGDFRCKFGVFPDSGRGYAIYTNGNLGFRLIGLFEQLLLDPPPVAAGD